ncbi:uncharacterized protein SPPG_05809 [Spizellomyces punctatus DAOM BR117]|uniref:Uncharacterized protein n=1 Tax=Spizellomyces punctatus (strain DAOM BR117) TaxID=645134 RepID=A0A0L0HD07_SPIPD|nr:uncharacterized protein SPPG_05809 [Spizellomyces punctatus DAOM BR117]KNC98834.1 hypothetical protein SPPG_05809 [Spizellomyces punctatus DAOM BR117]|eukprot:XP_016606874.1 hypothetical protein SPPG_05809 [Spizellomyces punctatus DAOM BR117]
MGLMDWMRTAAGGSRARAVNDWKANGGSGWIVDHSDPSFLFETYLPPLGTTILTPVSPVPPRCQNYFTRQISSCITQYTEAEAEAFVIRSNLHATSFPFPPSLDQALIAERKVENALYILAVARSLARGIVPENVVVAVRRTDFKSGFTSIRWEIASQG